MRSEHLDGRVVLHGGDSRDVLKGLADCSIDSVVTDPPYALVSIVKRFGSENAAPANDNDVYARASAGFMGKQWDTGETAFAVEFWAEIMRVLKPGGHVVGFGGTRTYHRLAVAIEDAGFEIRDQLAWVYGSGFPKSHSMRDIGRPELGTALKPAWEPIVMARKPLAGTVAATVLAHGTGALNIDGCRVGDGADKGVWPVTQRRHDDVTFTLQPVETDASKGRWPANIIHDGSDEVVAAFPSSESPQPRLTKRSPDGGNRTGYGAFGGQEAVVIGHGDSGSAARYFYSAEENDTEWLVRNLNLSHADIAEFLSFPPNGAVCSALSDAVTSALPVETRCDILCPERFTSATRSELRAIVEAATAATRSIVEKSLFGLPLESITASLNHAQYAVQRTPTGTITITVSHWTFDGSADPVTFNITPTNSAVGAPASARSTARLFYSGKADKQDRIGSKHPTVKPVDLMQWLCRLVTPPGGVVLDPFAGSGSTGEAAWREGFQCVLIEREPEYQADIAERLRLADKGPLERRQRAIKQSSDIGGLFADDNTKDTQIAA